MPSSKTRVNVVCDYCGEIYNTEYSVWKHAHDKFPKDCCSKCTGKKTSEVTFNKRRDKYWALLEDFCLQKDYVLLTKKEEYTSVKMRIEYYCKKHGYKTAILENMIHGHGCPDCKNEEMTYIMQTNPDDVERYINSVNGNKLLNKDDFKTVVDRNLKIKCGCGRTYTTSFVNFKNHGVQSCPHCSYSQSKNERYISAILEKMNIDFMQEYRLDDCRDKRTLPFDFYLPNYNLVIEYDGEGHYMREFYDCHNQNPDKELLDRQYKDKIKDEYCANNNINILRIPYWESDNIEQIISNKLKKLKDKT